jgi:hypothetical protein
MNPVNKDTLCLWGKELLRSMGLPIRASESKETITKCMIRNDNTITLKNVCADNSIVRLLHELEELNTLNKIFFDLLVIGPNNFLGGHTMFAQTVTVAYGSLINKTRPAEL